MKTSIIVPVFNTEKYIERCLDSVKEQTEEDWECIVVNDGSIDGSLREIIAQTDGDPRFTIVSSTKNNGLFHARNLGLAVASGVFVTFLDSDDWLFPEALSTLLAEMERNPEADRIVGLEMNEWEATGEKSIWKIEPPGLRHRLSPVLFTPTCDVGHVTGCLYRRKAITSFPRVRVFEDMIFNMEFAFAGKRTFISTEVVYHYTRRNGSLITGKYTLADAREARDAFASVVLMHNPPELLREQYRTFLENAIRGRLRRMGIVE